jgi:hypothetical protein
MGDRFYGSPALIGWCRAKGWGFRVFPTLIESAGLPFFVAN